MADRLSLSDDVEPRLRADVLLEATLPPASDHRQGGVERATRLIESDPALAGANAIDVARERGHDEIVNLLENASN